MKPKLKAGVDPAGLPGRAQNVVSYAVTLVVFLTVGLWRTGSGTPGMGFWLPAGLWSLHFARRTLESAFLHRYTRTVSVADTAGEYVYYWGFAAWIAWTVASRTYHLPPQWALGLGCGIFTVAEVGNFYSHVLLARLRPNASETARRIPRGFLFERVSCPHYLFEILSWVGFSIATQTLGGLAFTALGAGILVGWATKRHRAYLVEFDGKDGREQYPARRRILVPFAY